MLRGNIFLGAHFVLSGFRLCLHSRLRRFILVPLFINTVIFGVIIGCLVVYCKEYYLIINKWFPRWILGILGFVIWSLFSLIVGFMTSLIFTLATNLIAAPFYGLLAERTTRYLANTTQSELILNCKTSPLALLVPQILLRELKKIAYFTPLLLLNVFILIFPITFAFSPFSWALTLAWINAIQYVDYAADNQHASLWLMVQKLKQEPLTVIGFGGTVGLLMTLPGANLIVPAAAVVGGTQLWHRLNQMHLESTFNPM